MQECQQMITNDVYSMRYTFSLEYFVTASGKVFNHIHNPQIFKSFHVVVLKGALEESGIDFMKPTLATVHNNIDA